MPKINCTNAEERLLAKRVVDPVTGCWVWGGTINHDGTGKITYQYRTYSVKNLAAMVWLGAKPGSIVYLKHDSCCRKCFNPEHLVYFANRSAAMEYRRRVVKYGRGEDAPTAKLTQAAVDEARLMRSQGFSYPVIARFIKRQFGIAVHRVTIGAVCRGNSFNAKGG